MRSSYGSLPTTLLVAERFPARPGFAGHVHDALRDVARGAEEHRMALVGADGDDAAGVGGTSNLNSALEAGSGWLSQKSKAR